MQDFVLFVVSQDETNSKIFYRAFFVVHIYQSSQLFFFCKSFPIVYFFRCSHNRLSASNDLFSKWKIFLLFLNFELLPAYLMVPSLHKKFHLSQSKFSINQHLQSFIQPLGELTDVWRTGVFFYKNPIQ